LNLIHLILFRLIPSWP